LSAVLSAIVLTTAEALAKVEVSTTAALTYLDSSGFWWPVRLGLAVSGAKWLDSRHSTPPARWFNSLPVTCHSPLRGYVKELTANHHPELRKPESVRLAAPKSDEGGLVASRLRDGSTIANSTYFVN